VSALHRIAAQESSVARADEREPLCGMKIG